MLLAVFISLHLLAFLIIIGANNSFKKTFFHPVNFFFCVCYGHFFLAYTRDLSTDFPIVIVLISAVVVNTTLLFIKPLLPGKNVTVSDTNKHFIKYGDNLLFTVAFAVLSVGFLAFNYLLITLDINIVQYFLGLSHYYLKTRQGTAWVFFVISFSTLGSILYLACATRFSFFSILSLVLPTSFLTLTTGGRSSIIIYLIQVSAVLLTRPNYQLTLVEKPAQRSFPSLIFVFIFLVFVAFGINTNARLDVGLAEYFSDAVIIDFDKGRNLDTFIKKYPDSTFGVYHGRTLLDILQFFVPRSLNPDKEISTYGTRDLNPDDAESGSNDTFGLIPLAYFNFGIIGVVLEMILFTISYTLVYNRLLSHSGEGTSWKKSAYAVVISYEYILLNGGILNHFIFLLFLQLIFLYILSKLVYIFSRLLAGFTKGVLHKQQL